MDILPYDIQEYIYHLKHKLELTDVLNEMVNNHTDNECSCDGYKCNKPVHILDINKISDCPSEYEVVYLCRECFTDAI